MQPEDEYGDDVVDRKILPPEPGLVRVIEVAHHSLRTAVADLVDNSIDAHADHVLISFEARKGMAVGLTVVDNGWGMNGDEADDAMRLGHHRKRKSSSHGHFGIGLKAAAFSHADILTVSTRPRR